VIAPDGHAADFSYGRPCLGGKLSQGAVVVKAQHRIKAGCRQRGRRLHGDVGVRVAGVADNENLHVAGGDFVKGLTLNGEDCAVRGQEFTSVHALGTRAGANEERSLRVTESNLRVARGDHVGYQWEGAVGEFHHHAL